MISNRRRFIECCGEIGLGSTLLPGALAALEGSQPPPPRRDEAALRRVPDAGRLLDPLTALRHSIQRLAS